MKRVIQTLLISVIASVATLGAYHYITTSQSTPAQVANQTITNSQPASKTQIAGLPNFTKAADHTVHSVVHVTNVSYQKQNPMVDFFYGYRQQSQQPQIGTGSGVIISKDGYIVTNYHVINGASKLAITLNNNQTYPAQVVGADRSMDIALLKIDAKEDLPYSTFGDSDAIEVGDWVLAVGNPYNLNSTVTAGIVSAKARNLSPNSIQSFIQTDAAVNPGNSGGALVNTQGELVGINTMISSNTGSYVGYSFAVPSNMVKRIVEDLKNYGEVKRGYLGVQGMEITPEIAQYYHLDSDKGFYVGKAQTHNENALQEGDIITHINGKEIQNFKDLALPLATKRPGDRVEVQIIRGGQTQTLSVTLIEQ